MSANNKSVPKGKLVLMVVALGCMACSDESRNLPMSTAPSTVIGTVTGLVRYESPILGRSTPTYAVLPDATVTVIGGVASGHQATTGADGKYTIIAAGTFKLRFEHPWFRVAESAEKKLIDAYGTTSMGEVLLRTAPWTISGRVTDSLGNPLPDAQVAVGFFNEGFFLPNHGVIRTDAAGRYVLNSTEPHFETLSVVVSKPGFRLIPEVWHPKCCGALPDVQLTRTLSISPTAPSY